MSVADDPIEKIYSAGSTCQVFVSTFQNDKSLSESSKITFLDSPGARKTLSNFFNSLFGLSILRAA